MKYFCNNLLSSGHHEILLVIVVLILHARPTTQQTNCQPVNVGLIVALPWDVSNTLRAPIGGPVSLALSAMMALILVFGFLLAPVNYILGYPSRIYHPARRPGLLSELLYNEGWTGAVSTPEVATMVAAISNGTAEDLYTHDEQYVEVEARKMSYGAVVDITSSPTLLNLGTTNAFPDFISSAFFLIPEDDINCRKLILCHAHGFLTIFPTRLTKFVQFFSKRLMSIPKEYQSAVVLGLNNQAECQKVFKCPKNISALLKDVTYSLLNSELKDFWKLEKLF